MLWGTHQTYDNTEVGTPDRSLRSSSQKADTQRTRYQNRQNLSLDRFINGTVLQWLQLAHKKRQVFVANRAVGILENSSMDQWRRGKGDENPANSATRGIHIEGFNESMCLNGRAWPKQSEDKWPKPWCQEKYFEPERVTSTLTSGTKLDQLFDWRRYSTFKQIRNFIAFCMRFKTKQKGPLKADTINQAEQKLF